jgi:hypothetical protein
MGWFGQGHNTQGTLCPRDATSKNFWSGHIGRGRTNIQCCGTITRTGTVGTVTLCLVEPERELEPEP